MPLSPKLPGIGKKTIFVASEEALWLTIYFETHVLAMANLDHAKKGRAPLDTVGHVRREKFYDHARALLIDRGLDEVVRVVDSVFNRWNGFLPFEPDDHPRGRHWVTDRKVTNIGKIRNNYERLLAHCESSESVPSSTVEVVSEPSLKVNYGKPFTNPAAEKQVDELVELFTDLQRTRGREVHPSRTSNWAKSFRIMLGRRSVPFDDLKCVVIALTNHYEMDRDRYPDPYHLYRDGVEWNCLLRQAQTLNLVKERRQR